MVQTMTDHKSSIPELSIAVRLLILELGKAEVGTVIPYERFSAVIGKDICEYRHLLESARKILERDRHIVFEAVYKVGIKRMADGDICRYVGPTSAKRIHAITRRGLKKLACVESEKLPKEKLTDYFASMSFLGTMAHVTKPKKYEELSSAVSAQNQKLLVETTLELFKK